MRDAKPGQVSSLAACLVAGLSTLAVAADLPKRTAVPFVVDPFAASTEPPLSIGRVTPSGWMEAQERTETAIRGVRLAYQSFNFVCRKGISECPAEDELHCDVTTFGKSMQEDGKWVLVPGVTKTRECVRTADLQPHQNGMHSSVRFEGPGFDIPSPVTFKDFPPLGSVSP